MCFIGPLSSSPHLPLLFCIFDSISQYSASLTFASALLLPLPTNLLSTCSSIHLQMSCLPVHLSIGVYLTHHELWGSLDIYYFRTHMLSLVKFLLPCQKCVWEGHYEHILFGNLFNNCLLNRAMGLAVSCSRGRKYGCGIKEFIVLFVIFLKFIISNQKTK